jgi:hypothetical protein
MTEPQNGRVLDYVPRLVEANNRFLVRDLRVAQEAAEGVDLWNTAVDWRGGAVLDQGQEGSCVGHGVVGEYLASPVRGKGDAISGHALAVEVYNRAKEIDEWEGVNYDGTSVRAGMLVGRERGWWDSFHWAKSMEELRQALQLGPVVIGVTWLADMYEADRGVVTVGGNEVGGHCLIVDGYFPRWNRLPRFRWRNSWGLEYGIRGNGYVSRESLDQVLFQAGNECAVPTGRHL